VSEFEGRLYRVNFFFFSKWREINIEFLATAGNVATSLSYRFQDRWYIRPDHLSSRM